MSKSSTLRVEDGRAIITLVGECRDSGDDWGRWQGRWIEGLLKLTDAELGLSGEIADFHGAQFRAIGPPAMQGRPGFAIDPPRLMAATNEFGAVPGKSDFVSKYQAATRVDDGIALTNRDFFQDRPWRASLDMQTVGEAYGTDAALLCSRLMPRLGASLVITIARAKGRRTFTARDCTVVREAVAAIAPLMGGPLARFAEPSPADLPPQARRVLACLLQGDGDKQVAARLKIGTHTVNQYAKLIFRHFGVRSRAELLARWIRRGWGGEFPWAD